MKFKYTLMGQILSVLKTHAVSALVFSVLWFMLIAVTVTDIGGMIFSVLATVCYVISMYSCGFDALTNDKKTYSLQSPDIRKSFILTAALIIINILMLVMYKAVWTLYGSGTMLTSVWGIVGNVTAMAWFAPYAELAGMEAGSFSIIGYVMIFVMPLLSVSAGYIAGFYGVDIGGKISCIMYEKTKQKKETKKK